MVQLAYNYTNGQNGTPGPDAEIVSVPNPIALGTSNIDQNADTTDGDYTVALYLDGVTLLDTATYAAVSKSAAQIIAGITAAILARPIMSGYIKSMVVHDTVESLATYWDPTMALTMVVVADPASAQVITNTAPVRTTVLLGEILQANGAGGWTRTYTDASLALGVVCRSGEILLPLDQADPGGPQGPCVIALVKRGDIDVVVEPGVTVLRGEKAAYSPTTKTWRNNVTGTWVLVEGAQWQTTGTGVQKINVQLPSET